MRVANLILMLWVGTLLPARVLAAPARELVPARVVLGLYAQRLDAAQQTLEARIVRARELDKATSALFAGEAKRDAWLRSAISATLHGEPLPDAPRHVSIDDVLREHAQIAGHELATSLSELEVFERDVRDLGKAIENGETKIAELAANARASAQSRLDDLQSTPDERQAALVEISQVESTQISALLALRNLAPRLPDYLANASALRDRLYTFTTFKRGGLELAPLPRAFEPLPAVAPPPSPGVRHVPVLTREAAPARRASSTWRPNPWYFVAGTLVGLAAVGGTVYGVDRNAALRSCNGLSPGLGCKDTGPIRSERAIGFVSASVLGLGAVVLLIAGATQSEPEPEPAR